MIAADRLAHIFVEVADTLVDDFDLIEFLQMLTVRSVRPARASARRDCSSPTTTAGSSSWPPPTSARQMVELFQLQAHEGPCQECFAQGAAIIGADLANAGDRWPRFAPRAVAAGSVPCTRSRCACADEVIGALNLFSTRARHA